MKHLLLPLLTLIVGTSSAQVVQIPTVVHVLWNQAEDDLSDSLIQATIELVNLDFRRQNADSLDTPERFLPFAADTEIELVLVDIDPNGNPTSGITHTYTDTTVFEKYQRFMMYSDSGGTDAWNPCRYLNIWSVPRLANGMIGLDPGFSTRPNQLDSRDGIVFDHTMPQLFGPGNYDRFLTRFVSIYLDLYYVSGYGSSTCLDMDSVSDTPEADFYPSLLNNISCGDTLSTCNNLPNGDMYMNFMAYDDGDYCVNMFTQGQKERMHQTLQNKRPGLIDPSYCDVNSIADDSGSPLVIHPNPTTDQFSFELQQSGVFEILDIRGRIINSGTAFKGKNTLHVEHLNPGVHLLKITDNEGVSTARFIKQ